MKKHNLKTVVFVVAVSLLMSACGGGSSSSLTSSDAKNNDTCPVSADHTELSFTQTQSTFASESSIYFEPTSSACQYSQAKNVVLKKDFAGTSELDDGTLFVFKPAGIKAAFETGILDPLQDGSNKFLRFKMYKKNTEGNGMYQVQIQEYANAQSSVMLRSWLYKTSEIIIDLPQPTPVTPTTPAN